MKQNNIGTVVLVAFLAGCGGGKGRGDAIDEVGAEELPSTDSMLAADIGFSEEGVLGTCPDERPWEGQPCIGSIHCEYQSDNGCLDCPADPCWCSGSHWKCITCLCSELPAPDVVELSVEDAPDEDKDSSCNG